VASGLQGGGRLPLPTTGKDLVLPISSRFASLSKRCFPVFSAVIFLGLSIPASGQLAEGNDRLALPRSYLDEPFDGAVFVTGHGSIGGAYDGLGAGGGYGGTLIFRPGSPVNIFNALFRWNVGTVFQVDHQTLDNGGSWTSADIIVRNYFGNRGDRETEVTLFLGLGSGGSERRPEGAEREDYQMYWTWLVEGGQEWHFKPGFLFLVKAQYRWFLVDGDVDGMWSVQAGAGFRWP